MSALKSIVPPLALCQQLQPWDFPESALVWICNDIYDRVEKRILDRVFGMCSMEFSAPTLAEILSKLPPGSIVGKDRNKFLVQSTLDIIDMAETDENPTTAALRIWLRLNGREVPA